MAKAKCVQCWSTFEKLNSKKACHDCAPYDHSDPARWTNRINLYGVDKNMYEAMYFDQDGSCAICRNEEATHIDHNHDTGKVRALLCHKCNCMLGMATDDAEVLRAGVRYLEDQ